MYRKPKQFDHRSGSESLVIQYSASENFIEIIFMNYIFTIDWSCERQIKWLKKQWLGKKASLFKVCKPLVVNIEPYDLNFVEYVGEFIWQLIKFPAIFRLKRGLLVSQTTV